MYPSKMAKCYWVLGKVFIFVNIETARSKTFGGNTDRGLILLIRREFNGSFLKNNLSSRMCSLEIFALLLKAFKNSQYINLI